MTLTGEYVTQWVAKKLGVTFTNAQSLGFTRNGRLVGGVVFHDYRKSYGSLQMSCASIDKRWLSKEKIGMVFDYPFRQLGCSSVYACVSSEDLGTQAFVMKVGFKPAGLLRKGFGTVDAVLYDMLAEDCKWSSHERFSSQPAAAGLHRGG